MDNSIKNHNITSKADLFERQDAIQNEYEALGKDIVGSVLSPIKIAGLAYSVFSSKKTKKTPKPQQQLLMLPNRSLKETTTHNKKSKVSSFVKSVAASWLRWQAFNIAFYLGKKTIQHFKEKKAK